MLKEHPYDGEHLTTCVDGQDYALYYCPGTSVIVPTDRPYSISGDNDGGFVVTVTG